ncbi:MAG: N-acetylneuraminate synthase family protein [Myxococcota bacterium]
MGNSIKLGDRWVGDGTPVYVVAEIGINHNGDLDIAKRLIDAAVRAGCDAVKFQKRTPELCVPEDQREVMRDTPFGYVSYLEYRERIEFGPEEYREIDRHCRQVGISWFASCWDEASVDFMEPFEPPCYKVSSASLTDCGLLLRLRSTGRPLIVSTGMSTMSQVRSAVDLLGVDNLVIVHCTSTYPCPPRELNLRVIKSLREQFDCPIGYSGHEVGLATTVAAVALGASVVERHLTLDRAMWGSDQAASIEAQGMERLVRYIRTVEEALGTGVKEVFESELPLMRRLRRTGTDPVARK